MRLSLEHPEFLLGLAHFVTITNNICSYGTIHGVVPLEMNIWVIASQQTGTTKQGAC